MIRRREETRNEGGSEPKEMKRKGIDNKKQTFEN